MQRVGLHEPRSSRSSRVLAWFAPFGFGEIVASRGLDQRRDLVARTFHERERIGRAASLLVPGFLRK